MMVTNNKIGKALIYCRVSTEEQAKEGYSLDAQEKSCSRFIKDNGYRIGGVYKDEGKSATNLNRPALKDLLAECQQSKSIDAVVVLETDRLARNTKDHLTIRAMLKKAGIKLISVAQPMLDDSPEGDLIDTILASINQFQSAINGRKTKKALQEKFNSGWWPGWAPLGYMSKTINDKKTVVPDPDRWQLIKEGLNMYQSGNYSALQIIDILHQKGLRSKTDKKVCNSIMINTLKNPFYAGIMKWNDQEKPGKHTAMITLDEHKQILSIMEGHNMHACRRRKHSFLLRGFVFCDICGQRYTAEKHRDRKKVDYYHCSASSKRHSNEGQNIEVKELEKQIEEKFKNIQFSKEFINIIIQKVQKFYQERKSRKVQEKKILSNKKMAMEKKRDIAEEKLLAGVLTDESFIRIRERCDEGILLLQNGIDEIDNKHDVNIDTIREVLMLSQNIYKAYKKAPYEIKRLYLSFFWDGFWVRDKRIIKARPTKLVDALVENRKVIIRSDLLWGLDNIRACFIA